ncbi:hypothetical protein [Pedosphaera parvula]|uniref:Uncharacterized protein n=1 Tax=Pedosphaera parvula (strain Ellin514) TaxID=320771 RepID=B9XQI8_PEDPL|nr:hypothetical protein [Pedosphaera parvula]EEF57913.1 hypothetical protein Cflav_PD0863 [Pedosphaera parvula Ellin514]
MNWLRKWILLLPFCAAQPLLAQLEVVHSREVQSVFSGPARSIEVIFRNPGTSGTNVSVRTRMYQVSSSTAAPFGKSDPWKTLQVLSSQTVLESGTFNFPEVKSMTRFLIQWIDDAAGVIGKTEVFVFPTNLLTELHPLAKGLPVGVYDPENHLKPLLKAYALDVEDLADTKAEKFSGNLAIVWSPIHLSSKSSELKRKVAILAKADKAVVWIVPDQEPGAMTEPRMLPVQAVNGTVVIVQSSLVSDFQLNPQSQLNLLRAVGLATMPEQLHFSENNR